MHTGNRFDYPRLTKVGFLLGVSMLIVGALGELIGHVVLGGLPGWEETLFFDMEVVGTLLMSVSPFLFGIFLPLLE